MPWGDVIQIISSSFGIQEELQLFYRQTYKISKLTFVRATRKFQHTCLFTGFTLSHYQNNKCHRYLKGEKVVLSVGQQKGKATLGFFFFS